MIINNKHVELLAIIFFTTVVAVVFQQIFTSLTEQGIAAGGPYDNAAAYPRAVAILIGTLVLVRLLIIVFSNEGSDSNGEPKRRDYVETLVKIGNLTRPFCLLVIFAVYLGTLEHFGYHLTTIPMVVAIMLLCGMRNFVIMVVSAIGISLLLAFLFENFLNVVLPGGILHLNIPW